MAANPTPSVPSGHPFYLNRTTIIGGLEAAGFIVSAVLYLLKHGYDAGAAALIAASLHGINHAT